MIFLVTVQISPANGAKAYHLTTLPRVELTDRLTTCEWRTIAEAKQHWSVIGWVTKNILSRAPTASECTFGQSRLYLQSSAPVNPHWVRGGLWPVLLMCKEGLCPSSGDINRLMMSRFGEELDDPAISAIA
jgi:hypothetical protein